VGNLLHIIGAGRVAVYDEREEKDVGQIDDLADQADGDQGQVGALAPANSKRKGDTIGGCSADSFSSDPHSTTKGMLCHAEMVSHF